MTATASPRRLRLALCQHPCGDDPEANFATAAHMMAEASARGADVAVTQELFAFRYFPQREDPALFQLAEPVPGPTTQRLGRIARDRGLAIHGSVFERRAAGLFHNTTVVIGPDGRLLERYRKMHIPHDPLYYEKFYFAPGDLGFRTAALDQCRLGMLICWDQWFPEAARATTLEGAELLVYPTAIGWHTGTADDTAHQELEAWRTVQRSHAVANGVYVAAANRVGREGHLHFWGGSFVAAPSGRILAEAPQDEPHLLVCDLDLAVIDTTRREWPFLRDRRIDAYRGLLDRYGDL